MLVLTKLKYQVRFHYLTSLRVTIILVSLLSTGLTPPQTEVSREYQVKAVFLFNFCQFVEWPSSAFSREDEPLVIGILGNDPFGKYLDETVMGEKVKGHPLVVKRFQKTDQIENCHVLFINLPEKAELDPILKMTETNNVLTVADGNNFSKRGGMMNFFTEDNKIRIRINVEAAKRANLTISSKLLKVADLVNQRNN